MGMGNSYFIRNGILAVGVFATGLAIVGIFLPLLPTVPLLLLAAACFARSSERFHSWLLNHQKLGPMIHCYLDGKGIPFRAKINAIGLICLSISFSVYLVNSIWLKFLLATIGVGVTLYLLSLETCRDN
jgi:uncharacterized membrane protein YbaN (DUF454 family)